MSANDDDLITDAFARRRLTAREDTQLSHLRGFIDRGEFATSHRSVRMAVEALVAFAVAALAITLVIALARHQAPTSTIGSRPGPNPPSVVTRPSVPPTPSPTPSNTCTGLLPQGTPTGLLTGIQALGAEHIWMVGDGRILSSHDGGANWRLEYTGPEQFSSVDAIDDNHAWAVAGDSLLGTTDGGRTWTHLAEPFSPLASVHFVGDKTGFGVVASTCSLAVTADGGHVWQVTDAAPPGVTSVCFTDAGHGWVGAGGQLWRTGNGGATWKSVLDTRDPAFSGITAQLAVECASGGGVSVEAFGVGGAAGNSPNAAWVSSSGDQFTEVWAGGMWPASDTVANGPGSYPGPFSIVDSRHTVWIGNTPALYPYNAALLETAGTNTVAPSVPVTCEGLAVAAAFTTTSHGWVLCLVNPSVGGAASEGTSVLVTNDAGHTWTVKYTARR